MSDPWTIAQERKAAKARAIQTNRLNELAWEKQMERKAQAQLAQMQAQAKQADRDDDEDDRPMPVAKPAPAPAPQAPQPAPVAFEEQPEPEAPDELPEPKPRMRRARKPKLVTNDQVREMFKQARSQIAAWSKQVDAYEQEFEERVKPKPVPVEPVPVVVVEDTPSKRKLPVRSILVALGLVLAGLVGHVL
jgi:hypothetical protein